jgi:hypothetical protein
VHGVFEPAPHEGRQRASAEVPEGAVGDEQSPVVVGERRREGGLVPGRLDAQQIQQGFDVLREVGEALRVVVGEAPGPSVEEAERAHARPPRAAEEGNARVEAHAGFARHQGVVVKAWVVGGVFDDEGGVTLNGVPAEAHVARGLRDVEPRAPAEPLAAFIDEADQRDGHAEEPTDQPEQVIEAVVGGQVELCELAQTSQTVGLVGRGGGRLHDASPSGGAVDHAQEHVGAEGLAHEREPLGRHLRGRVVTARGEHREEVRPQGAGGLDELGAAHPGHVQVGEEHVERVGVFTQGLQRVGGVVEHPHQVPAVGEDHLRHPRHERVVVDHGDASLQHGVGARLRARRPLPADRRRRCRPRVRVRRAHSSIVPARAADS